MNSLLPVVAAAFLASCAAPERAAARAPFPLGADILPQEDYLTVTGYGLPEGPASSATQLKARTRDAAILDARGRLKAYLESIAPSAAAKAAGLARRARVVYVNWEDDGGATAMLALDKDRINDALKTSFR